ncbi:thiol:disulfide interchange protein DsbG [Cupriavidus sp. CV2]|uniref:thiol:disulfide interchange protein DsbG n=1 Tax=Cupriavidus ulmosensis TaxID=3065913 RepID=UPI00296B391B|nr:thiol:disulfide interchange protein DsbG [Cupriavidus sp. CV2]MDW3688612.1 thiol:disulfide interchange protein DsbG [Cupriavidus sp. CV2]
MQTTPIASKSFRLASHLWLAAVALSLACGPSFGQDTPAALRALEKQGLTIVGKMASPTGLTAYAGYMDQQPVALYVTPDGKQVIAGTLFDGNGKDLTRAALEEAVRKPMSERAWKELEQASWISDGRDNAPRKVYVFTDPNCPYCNKFWSDARPWVDSGKVQLRHIMVGILTPSSAGKAAALLADKNPVAALKAYEQGHTSANARALAGGHPKPLDGSGIKLLSNIAPSVKAKLDANEKLMASFGLQATPAMLWRDANGQLGMRQGVPASAMAEVLGPR